MSDFGAANRPTEPIEDSNGFAVSSNKFNKVARAVRAQIPGIQGGKQIVQPPQAKYFGFFHAVTTTQTTGQTLTCSVYENGLDAAPTAQEVSVFCGMLSTAAVVAVGVYLLAVRIGGSWHGFIAVMAEEPA